MTITIQRLYKGMATLRSYQAQKAINKRQKLIIKCDGEQMTIPFDVIDACIVSRSAPIPSKFNIGNTYELWDFLWYPDKV